MTFEELQDLLAEQFSCDTSDLSRGTALADLGAKFLTVNRQMLRAGINAFTLYSTNI